MRLRQRPAGKYNKLRPVHPVVVRGSGGFSPVIVVVAVVVVVVVVVVVDVND